MVDGGARWIMCNGTDAIPGKTTPGVMSLGTAAGTCTTPGNPAPGSMIRIVLAGAIGTPGVALAD